MVTTAGRAVTQASPLQRWLSILVILGSMAAGATAGRALAQTATLQTSTVEVLALVDRGSVFRLYFNNTWSDPQTARIRPGEWTVYRFAAPSRLTALRFDPADAANAHVLVKSVTVRSGDRAVAIAPADLERWLRTDLIATYDATTATIQIATQQRASYLMGGVDVDLTRQSNPLLRHFRLNAITLLWCAFLVGASALVLSIGVRDVPVAVAIAATIGAAVTLAYYAAPRVLVWSPPPADVSLTVGLESFFGLSKAAELRAVNVAVLSGAALALGCGWLLRRFVAARAPAALVSRPTGLTDVLLLAACLLVFALGALPAATELQRVALSVHHSDDFDGINFLLWQYLHSIGSLPWRDYWFPYSGMYDSLAPLWPDITIRWSHGVLLAAVMLVTVFLVVRRSWIAAVAASTVWIYLDAMGLFVAGSSLRYFLSASLVVVAAVALKHRHDWAGAALGVWAFYVFQEEVSQAVYAAPALLLMGAAAVASAPAGVSRVKVIRQLLVASAAFGVCAAVMIASLVRHGQLQQWWEFVTTVGVMSNYSGWPSDIPSWFTAPDAPDRFFVFITIVLIVGGLLQAVWTRFNDLYLLVPAGFGLVSLMLLQKQVIRPGIEGQLLAVPVLGLALLVTQQLQQRPARLRYTAWLTFSTVTLVTCFTYSVPTERDKASSYLDITSGLVPDLQRTLSMDEAWRRARESYFSPSSVTFGTLSGDEFGSRVHALTGLAPSESVFVLGDHANIYLALRRPVAFYPNFYNQSPIFSQQKTLAWVHERDPKVLFWDSADKIFDGVPNPVRVPLLYNYAITQFVPLGTVENFEVLRRRRAAEPIALDYWRAKLGTSLDLGYIPANSRALVEAREGGTHRMRYLVARVASPVEAATYSLSLQLAGGPYVVQFKGRAGVTDYPIALERLPFAAADQAMGAPTQVLSADRGVTPAIMTLEFSTERLY
jgi:hypothetical protein